jgi:RHS repeat-associated protein
MTDFVLAARRNGALLGLTKSVSSLLRGAFSRSEAHLAAWLPDNPNIVRRQRHSNSKLEKIARVLAIVGATLLCPPVVAIAADSAPAMITPGQLNVNSMGNFNYSIPIAIPPGTAGLAPSLVLGYSSRAGDGILGMGWSLGGIPSIGRCARTVAQDGVHGGVNYDTNDRFCLDGQRLILISGTYGADGSQYRTEIDGFSQITAHGQAGNGPAWFEVHSKSGQIMQFGNTADSKALATGTSTVRAWSVNQIMDTAGNYMTVTYTVDSANGEIYPAQINYTGNSAQSVSPYNSVQFVYETRPDVTPYYQAGSLTQRNQLLTDVKTYTGSSLVSDYKLTYQLGSTTRHSELTSIAQCDGAGACLPATTFGWQGSRDNPAMTALPNGSFQGTATTLGTLLPGAWSGQGLTDIYAINCNTGTSGIFYGTQTAGVFTSTPMVTANYYRWIFDPVHHTFSDTYVTNGQFTCGYYVLFKYRTAVDITGDGLTDLIIGQLVGPPVFPTQVGYFPLLNNGSNILTGQFTPAIYGALDVGDFNGDGRIDILSVNGPQTGFYINIGDGAGNFTQTGPLITPVTLTNTLGDFDGDGCTDILEQGSSSSTIAYSCAPAVATSAAPNLNSAHIYVGDFNGDGKADLLVVPTSGSANASIYLSTGTGFSSAYTIPSSTDWHKYQIITGDWNGDGLTDIALIAAGGSGNYGVGTSHQVYISTGTGFSLLQTIANTNSANTTVNAVEADLNDDGASDFWLQEPSGDTEYMFGYIPELITTVTNGIGVTTTVSYDRLNHATLYTKQTGDTYPTQDLNGPFYVVSRIDEGNGLGPCSPPSMANCHSSTYSYAGAKSDLQGRGFLGFNTVSVTDVQTGVIQTTTYGQTFPYIGLITSQTKISSGVTVNSTTNSYSATPSVSGTGAQFVYLTQTVSASNDLDGSAMPTTTTTYNNYDAYGNPGTITTSTPDGASSVTTNTYTNDTTHWYLGRLTQTSVTNTVPISGGSSVITRTSSFGYDAPTGLLNAETVEPGAASLMLNTAYVLDGFGNKKTTTVTGGSGSTAIAARTTTTLYDARGQFATTITNALNQSETWAYSAAFGSPSAHTGPNGLTTTWQYDTFGRKIVEVRPDGAETTYAYQYCSGVNGGTASCPTNGAFLMTASVLGSDHATQIAPTTTIYYDALSRPVAKEAQGFDGTVIHTDSQYDVAGRLYRASQPYFVGSPNVYWTTNTFDALGRTTSVSLPNTGTVTYAYHGLTTAVTDPNNHTTTMVKNDQGLNQSVTDAANSTTTYVYDAYGDVLTVTDPAGNVTTSTFDIRGRKLTVNDPDKGAWSYGYDALSELVSQTNAKSQTSTISYDLLGRPTQRVEPEFTSNWIYDTAAHGIGLLAQATTTAGYSRAFTYDTLSRPTHVALSIYGGAHSYAQTYDAISGKMSTLTYPSGLAIKDTYNAYGYLAQISDNTSHQVYWTANARDQFLNLINETAGNGVTTSRSYDARTGLIGAINAGPGNAVASFTYVFDLVGNLDQRVDNDLTHTDNFTYDALNRLSTYSLAGSAYQSMGYDALGDITSKPGIGTYAYPTAGQPRPHAVSSITGTVRGVTNPTFSYDADGNTLSGPGMTATYTSFDMASTVQGSTQWSAFHWGQAAWGSTAVTLSYDSEHQRMDMASAVGATYYYNDPVSGAASELYAPLSGSSQWRDYLMADGRMVAERTTPVGGMTPTWQYFVADHLGSIAVVTDASGAVLQRMIYDPWGAQLDQSGAQLCGQGTATTRGYTGEEQFPVDCLVNLNARLYDPILGRFLSADSVTSSIYDLQALNRYAYVYDNPLSLVDPNGQCGICIFIINIIADLLFVEVFKPLFEEVPLLGDLWILYDGLTCGPLCAAEDAGVLAGVESGNIGKGLEAFVLSYAEATAFNLVGDGLNDVQGDLGQLVKSGAISPLERTIAYDATAFVAHGFVGGVFSVAQGGSFESGFLSAGVSELASPYATQLSHGNVYFGTAIEAVVGGTTSAIGGGNFANGAVTAAFGYLFNYCAHNGCYTTSQERAYLNNGDYLGYYKLACAGGDTYACSAYHIAADDNLAGQVATDRLIDALKAAGDDYSAQTLNTIRLDLADAYANYLPQSGANPAWPTTLGISQLHWNVFGQFGLPPSTFGGTPFAPYLAPFTANITGKYIWPQWCGSICKH